MIEMNLVENAMSFPANTDTGILNHTCNLLKQLSTRCDEVGLGVRWSRVFCE